MCVGSFSTASYFRLNSCSVIGCDYLSNAMFNVWRLNEREGTATALSQHNVYQHTLYTAAFNVGAFKHCNSTS